MMSRVQRIEYEILDCALNRATPSEGFITTVILFMRRLEILFPDIETIEFTQACQGLTRLSAIAVSFPTIAAGYIHYQGADDDAELFDAKTLRLAPTSFSQAYYRQLSALIEAPTGFKHHVGIRR
jgi:hypothetical protein